jgi:hypothetical protein
MNKLLLGVLLIGNFVFSQSGESIKFSKINFTYEQKSNYHINNDGVYADTLLFSFDYPKLKYNTRINPTDSTKTVGFLAFKDFSNEDKRKLVSSLYHNTQNIDGTYDANNNITKLIILRNDTILKNIFKKYFKEKYRKFAYSVLINYDKKYIKTRYPKIHYNKKFATELRNIIFFDDDKNSGMYSYKTIDYTFSNLVTLNKNYDNKVVPDEVFSNNEFSVQKITTINRTTNLKFVSYE